MGNPYSKKNRRAHHAPSHSDKRDEKCGGAKPTKSETNSFVMLLKLVIEKYNLLAGPTAINLANLKQYDELKDQFLDFNTIRTCEAVMTCLLSHFEAVDTISFDHNGIKSPAVLLNVMKRMNMAGMYKALSFKDNVITDFSWISILKGFSAIQELRCVGCPISNDSHYRRQISKTLPSLILLDDKNTERVSLSLPWPKHPGGADGEIRNLCVLLAKNYQETMKSNVEDISRFYHEDATLTYTTSNSFSLALPNGALGSEVKEAVRIQQILGELNHNLGKSSPTSTKHNRIIKGSREVAESLCSIFKTSRMRIVALIDTDKHLSVTQPSLGANLHLSKVHILVIKFHGSFQVEIPSLQREIHRCFDRVWTLTKNASGEIVIYNDLLHIRSGETSPLWDPRMGERSMKLSKKYALPDAICNQIIELSSNDIQCSLIIEFVAITRLKPQPALHCLNQAENDLEKAQKLFEEKKSLLTAEHYL